MKASNLRRPSIPNPRARTSTIRGTVQNTPGYKRLAVYKCAVRADNVLAEVCRALSADPENNVICKDTECPSVWRACDGCVVKGTVAEQSTQINKKTHLCAACTPTPLSKSRKGKKSRVEEKMDAGDDRDLTVLIQGVMASGRTIEEIPVSLVRRFEGQPRNHFNPVTLEELGKSLLVMGQMQPILLRKLTDAELKREKDGRLYELVDGERRWRAAKLVGKQTLRAIVITGMDRSAIQYAISATANFGREDHTPVEEARAIQFMQKELRLTTQKTAEAFGKSVPWLYQRLKLLELDREVQRLLEPGTHVKRPLKLAIATMLAEVTKDHREIQVTAGKHFGRHPEMSVVSAERYIHGLFKEKGLEPPVREEQGIDGPAKTVRTLDYLVDGAWKKVEKLLAVPEVTFRGLPVDKRRREALKNNLHALSVRLQTLSQKL